VHSKIDLAQRERLLKLANEQLLAPGGGERTRVAITGRCDRDELEVPMGDDLRHQLPDLLRLRER
jgi:hypothetical protein